MYIPSDTPADETTPDTPNAFAFGEFVVDIGASKLLKGTAVVALPSRTFDVLVYLIQHRERSVKKDEIIAAIWDNVIVTDDSLIHAISVLRRALGDEAQQHRYIETIPRRGYRFVGKVQALGRAQDEVVPVQASAPAPAPAELPAEIAVAATPVLSDVPAAVMPAAQPLAAPAFARRSWALAAAASVVVFVAGALWLTFPQDKTPANAAADASVHLFQSPPAGMSIVSSGVLSPDSRYLAFVARDDTSGETGVWVRELYSGEARLIKDTQDASKPFWAPDSNRIGFFANGKLFTTDLNGENFQSVASSGGGAAGATWGADDTILFADWTSGLYAVAASGDGEVEPVLLLDRGSRDIAFAWPQFFPDGRFLFQVVSLDPERSGAYVGNMDTRTSFKVLDTTSSVTFAPPHYLLHVQRDMLIAEELDPKRLQLTGHAIVVARDIPEPLTAVDNFVSASTHLLAFKRGVTPQHLSWFDRSGQQVATLATPAPLYYARLSPNGTQLLGSSSVTADPGLWLTSIEREAFARIDKDATAPIWSPDGQRIAFTSRDGHQLALRAGDGSGEPTLLMQDDRVKILNDWSADGRYIVYTSRSAGTGLDLWTVDVETGVSRPLIASAAAETQARFSPDGNWIAYTSDESGSLEVFVARFPGLTEKTQASVGGGGQPQWRADQSELFYFSAGQSIMALDFGAENDTLALGAPRQLFRTPIRGGLGEAREYYAADANGTQFLIDTAANAADTQEISIMVNWAARLQHESASVAQASLPR